VIPLRDDNPVRRVPVLTYALIAVNTLVFLYQQSLPDDASLEGQIAFACEWGLVPDWLMDGQVASSLVGDVTCGQVATEHNRFVGLFTSQFLHGSWLHLLGNMLFLYIFGNNVEDRLGRIRFLPFYLLCGCAAGLSQAVTDANTDIPLIGASGAISGVLGAYVVLYPRAGVWTVVLPLFFLPFKIPAWAWLGIYFVLQFVYLGQDATAGGGGVAYWAHIGGFLAGALLIRVFTLGRPPPAPPHPAVPVY
jgi:membrane associated rhomboid family serine protease